MDTAYDDWAEPQHRATYSPEDNKIRIYPSGVRLDKELGDEYASFKAAGYKWAPKQECFVCARWTPTAEDWALRLAGEIDDEDYSYEERAADRAERFETYRDKRADEAGARADAFEAGPAAFGHQSRARAERQARRHDRHRTHAVSQWSKAEYWQRRTAGVISHALYKSSPKVRRSRILRLESERRATTKTTEDYRQRFATWLATDEAKSDPAKAARIKSGLANCDRWAAHYDLRLTYERAMLAEEGGAAYDAEMIPGGFIGSYQIHKINKSSVTGLVVSVQVWGKDWHGNPGWVTLNIERLAEDAYRAPTAEELQAFNEATAARKSATPPCPLINPTREDAQRLQLLWNSRSERAGETVDEMTAARYAALSKRCDFYRTVTVFADGCGEVYKPSINERISRGNHPVCKVRVGSRMLGPDSVIVLGDKPQKPLPFDWAALLAEAEPAEAGCLF